MLADGNVQPVSRDHKSRLAGGAAAPAGATATLKERQRVTKACDHCNQIRTKCDGVSPCSRCVAYQVACTFDRKSRRNGRRRRRATPPLLGRHPWPRPVVSAIGSDTGSSLGSRPVSSPPTAEKGFEGSISRFGEQPQAPSDGASAVLTANIASSPPLANVLPAEPNQRNGLDAFGSYETQLFGHLDGSYVSSLPPYLNEFITPAWQAFSCDSHTACLEKTLFEGQAPGYSASRLLHGFPRSDIGGPGEIGSRTPHLHGSGAQVGGDSLGAEYPVINSLLPFCSHQISPALACKLLEGYFNNFSDHDAYASSPFILTHVLRKESILSPTAYRDCKPALLSSMLLVAAQTVEIPFFGSAPTARHRLCRGLFDITVTLLSSNPPSVRNPKGATPNEKSAIVQERRLVGSSQSLSVFSATRTIDDVIAYMHLAVVSSAAEAKPVGSHWWHTAIQLAKELKLNIELPQVSTGSTESNDHGGGRPIPDVSLDGRDQPPTQEPESSTSPLTTAVTDSTSHIGMVGDTVTEDDSTAHARSGFEDQEERRRVWWCLYVLDRHMSLCYNSPLALRDSDCQSLLWPLDDTSWQAGAYSSHESSPRGPSAECDGPGIFGLFIPFAFILGKIVDARQLLGQRHCRTSRARDLGQILREDIEEHLGTFRSGLDQIALPARSKGWRVPAQFGCISESDTAVSTRLRYQRLMITYGNYFYRVLGVLLHSEWDLPTALGGHNGTPEQIPPKSPGNESAALSCATQAADALQDVLSQDHELKFNPFLMGIFLVQGSYPLLVAASRDMQRASTQVLRACKITLRAHETSVATLHSEYQRKNRKLLLSAIEGIQHGPSAITRDTKSLNERIIKLYRWSPGGRGLGL